MLRISYDKSEYFNPKYILDLKILSWSVIKGSKLIR